MNVYILDNIKMQENYPMDLLSEQHLHQLLHFWPFLITKARASKSGHKKFDWVLHQHNFVKELFWSSFVRSRWIKCRVECGGMCKLLTKIAREKNLRWINNTNTIFRFSQFSQFCDLRFTHLSQILLRFYHCTFMHEYQRHLSIW